MKNEKAVLYPLLITTLFGLILAGCDRQSESSSEEAPVPEMDAMIKFGTPPQADLAKPSMGEFTDQATSFYEAAESASTVEEAHRKVRKLLADSSSVARTFREQMAAFAMFANHFSDGDSITKNVTDEKLKILSFHTDLLVENRSPEASYILPALKALRGRWSSQKVVKSAQTVAQAARSTYGNSKSSEPASVQTLRRESGRSGHAGEALKAANELVQLNITLKQERSH